MKQRFKQPFSISELADNSNYIFMYRKSFQIYPDFRNLLLYSAKNVSKLNLVTKRMVIEKEIHSPT
jgi:hypothetical protein